MKSIVQITAGVLIFANVGFAAEDYYRHDNRNAVYRLEIKNDTEGQWFSPCLCALHSRRVNLFKEELVATAGQAVFAEDGFNGIFAEELRQRRGVYSVLQCESGLTPPGATRVEYIEGPSRARLTCASMPVTTNDVLTVVSRVRTPRRLYQTKYYYGTEWDLGTEENNYASTYMPLDSLLLTPISEENPVTIADSVVFYNTEEPQGTPTILNFFARKFNDQSGNVTAESTMSIFDNYEGSDEFPSELYGWDESASSLYVTRLK